MGIATDILSVAVFNLQSISHFNDSLDVNGHENGPNKCSKMFPCVNCHMTEIGEEKCLQKSLHRLSRHL